MDMDIEVGTIVWVRRKNGSWWPGRVLSASDLIPPPSASASASPVQLLGRQNGSVDWYNFATSKRVKPFRCPEFDSCIQRAQSMPPRKPTKRREVYVHREDAILHALDLEKHKHPPSVPLNSTPASGFSHENVEDEEEITITQPSLELSLNNFEVDRRSGRVTRLPPQDTTIQRKKPCRANDDYPSLLLMAAAASGDESSDHTPDHLMSEKTKPSLSTSEVDRSDRVTCVPDKSMECDHELSPQDKTIQRKKPCRDNNDYPPLLGEDCSGLEPDHSLNEKTKPSLNTSEVDRSDRVTCVPDKLMECDHELSPQDATIQRKKPCRDNDDHSSLLLMAAAASGEDCSGLVPDHSLNEKTKPSPEDDDEETDSDASGTETLGSDAYDAILAAESTGRASGIDADTGYKNLGDYLLKEHFNEKQRNQQMETELVALKRERDFALSELEEVRQQLKKQKAESTGRGIDADTGYKNLGDYLLKELSNQKKRNQQMETELVALKRQRDFTLSELEEARQQLKKQKGTTDECKKECEVEYARN